MLAWVSHTLTIGDWEVSRHWSPSRHAWHLGASQTPWSLWRWQRRSTGRGWVMEGELEVIKKVASSDFWSQFNFSIESPPRQSQIGHGFQCDQTPPCPRAFCARRVSNYEPRVNNLVWRIMETSFTRLCPPREHKWWQMRSNNPSQIVLPQSPNARLSYESFGQWEAREVNKQFLCQIIVICVIIPRDQRHKASHSVKEKKALLFSDKVTQVAPLARVSEVVTLCPITRSVTHHYKTIIVFCSPLQLSHWAFLSSLFVPLALSRYNLDIQIKKSHKKLDPGKKSCQSKDSLQTVFCIFPTIFSPKYYPCF